MTTESILTPASASSPPKAPLAPCCSPQLDAMNPLPEGPLALIDLLLRRRSTFLARAQVSDPVVVCRALIFTIAAGAAVFGVCLGLFRPGWQVLSSALKLPLLLLLTAAIATPALTGMRLALGSESRFKDDVLLVLSTIALVSLALAAFAPLVLMAIQWEASYHQVIVLVVGVCLLCGIGGVAYFLNNLRETGAVSVVLGLVTLTVFTLVGTQLAWTLRPYLARPRAQFEWVRPLEGSFVDSVARSADSAQGIYHRSSAPVPEGE